jgi:PHP family Zn ribbon phosphoesterase
MKWYRADLHIHSVLSPCGDLDMSPVRIIREAKKKKLDIIGLTDHNSTLHCELMIELGTKEGITVLPGVEINTREEVHCLAFFEKVETVRKFQEFIEIHLPEIKNKPEKFGYQLMVNEKEEILKEIENLLIVGLDCSIEDVERKVHELEGIFIPAHVDRQANGIFSQIGFISDDLKIDAIEFSGRISCENLLVQRPELNQFSLISNSDAHLPGQIGTRITEYYLEAPSFMEWKMALNNEMGRIIKPI